MKIIKVVSFFLMALSFSPLHSRADNEIVDLKVTLYRQSENFLPDGKVIGRGMLKYYGPHSEFRVWMPADNNGGEVSRYALLSKFDDHNKVLIRLETSDGTICDGGGNGFLLVGSSDSEVAFNIVSAGDQSVSPGRYFLTLNAAAN